jgi:hypothetical protein
MNSHLFISYSHEDTDYVVALASALTDAGFPAWFDRSLIPGRPWTRELEKKIATARAVLFVATNASVASHFVEMELHSARESNVLILPLLREPCRMPLVLKPIHWIDASENHYPIAAIGSALAEHERPVVPALVAPTTVGSRPLTFPGLLRYLLDRWFPRLHHFLTITTGSLSLPRERAGLVAQLNALAATIAIDFEEKTYLPLSARTVPTPSGAMHASKDPFVAPIHQVILLLAGRFMGGDLASPQIAAVNRRSRVVRNLLATLDSAHEPLVLLGEPGSGKTMTLQQTARLLALRESRRIFPRIVLAFRLGEFYCDGPVGPYEVWEFVQRSTPTILRDWLTDLANHGRLALFFDGMDEMSRDRYGEHTEALSLFAAQSGAKCLFTCRIADFNPRFLHARLVLLPFDYAHVREYLAKYISAFPLTIDGKKWTLKTLAKEIVSGRLAVEANNPFVLWLLCLYLQEKLSWPASRVELLRYYNEQNYRRKQEEWHADVTVLPPADEAFAEWGRFAYVITERNRGPAIPVHDLFVGGQRDAVAKAIFAGRRCGILAESRETCEYMIRFQHHRFQEYFTAVYIQAVQPRINWNDKLDAPRWQETIVNLVQMDGGHDVAEVLVATIRDMVAACTDHVHERGGEAGHESQTSRSSKRIVPELAETSLGDRVELASRLVHRLGAAPYMRERILPPVQDAVALLTEHGKPTTQVKIIRACQNVPDIDLITSLRHALSSRIAWVRNQALIVLAGSDRPLGTDLAAEAAYDLAAGTMLSRLRTYWQAAVCATRRGAMYSLAVALTCLAMNVGLHCVGAGALYVLLADAPVLMIADAPLSEPSYCSAAGAVVVAATALALRYDAAWLCAAEVDPKNWTGE